MEALIGLIMILLLMASFATVFILFLRNIVDGGWRHVYQHRCGYITEYSNETTPCASCGEPHKHDDWRSGIAKPSGLFGWRWK